MLKYFLLFVALLPGTFTQKKQPIVLIGTILLPDQTIDNGTVLIIDKQIAAVSNQVSIPNDAIIIHTNGVILPGFIDLHNHLTYNIFPRWKPSEEFGSRYDWQQKEIYRAMMVGPYNGLVEANLLCEMQRYAEIKAITQGATSVIGSLRKSCNQGLARNLDDDSTLGQILYNIFPLEMDEIQFKQAKDVLSSNGTLLIHLAEGSPNDASSAKEFLILQTRDLLKSGVSLIHGVALKENDFRLMANASVGFIWSLRSNLELYGNTANIGAALKNHIITAIAPDWSPTGSDGLLSELNFAAAWNAGLDNPLFDDRLLFEMATINPAKLVHLENRLGVLKEGYLADILVLAKSDNNQSKTNPYWTSTHATPEDVMLVIIDGEPIYGNPILMKKLIDEKHLESLDICGMEKSIHLNSQPTFHEIQKRLKNTLRHWSRNLAPLSECGN